MSDNQRTLYSTNPLEKRAWPTATWLSSTLDASFIKFLKNITGADAIHLEDRLESDLGIDDINLLEFHLELRKFFKLRHDHVCPFETWGDMCSLFSKENKAPYFDYSVAELIDMIVRSRIINRPLSKEVKNQLSQYDFSGLERAKNNGDKYKIRLLTTPLEPDSIFITDPFVVNRKRHETVDDVMNLFYYEELRHSDSLFMEIDGDICTDTFGFYVYSRAYKSRTHILKRSLSYEDRLKMIQANYRLMNDGNGYYVLKTTDMPFARKVATEFRRVLIHELNFVDLC